MISGILAKSGKWIGIAVAGTVMVLFALLCVLQLVLVVGIWYKESFM
ncbi:hypothetical protein [Paenibacillus hemerocallicola]|nr:hypothetical protein [Paenibacillus hemerocallicola]